MERTIIAPEFKGGIWYRFFSSSAKRDETLFSILDEKLRYYKLYYPFLEKKQIIGKAYEELGIPHICGDLNKKELHKLFLKERKNQYKLKDKYKKYPTLFIENKSKNKGMIKKPTIPTIKPIKVNSVRTKVEKSKDEYAFDNLLSNVHPKSEEGMIHNVNLKQIKSVRFNDGIEVHSVSPSQPLYKLKPLGRLFDEPSAVRAVDKQSYPKQELQERIEDSDSDFDADTGITSDAEDSEIEDSTQVEDDVKNTDMDKNEKVEENSLLNVQSKTIYDCSEEDSLSTDHEICKEGNDLILTSKMITVVQGKWVRETKQIIGDTYHTKDTRVPYRKSKEGADERQEFAMVRNIEQILENIKSLCISNTEEHDTSSVTISSINRSQNEQNMKVKKEQFVVGNVKVGQDLTDIKITIQDKNTLKQRKKVFSKNINSKISLEEDLSTQLVDETLLTIDSNKLSYEHDIHETKSTIEENIEKRIRTKPIKLVDDLIDYINDWNSSNEGSLSYNTSQTLSIKQTQTKDPKKEQYMKTEQVLEAKSVMDDVGSSEYLLIEKESCFEKEEDSSEESSLEEKSCLGNDEDSFEESSLEEKSCLGKDEDSFEESSFGEKSCLEKEEDSFEESRLEEKSCLEKEKDNFVDSSLENKKCLVKEEVDLEDLSLEEKICMEQKEEEFEDLSLEEKSCLKEQNYSLLCSVNNKQQESSQLVVSDTSINTTNQSIEIIKTEPSSLSDEIRNTKLGKTGYETHDYLPNVDMPLSKRDEISEDKEFQINDTFTIIRSMVCNQSTSNPNELYSTFCSLITKPILVQSQYEEEEGDNKLKSFEVGELDQENKKMQSEYSVFENELSGSQRFDKKTQGMSIRDNEIDEDVMIKSEENTQNNLKENEKIMAGQNLMKNSVLTMNSIDHSNSMLAGQQIDIENGDNTSKPFISDKKNLCEEPENILNDIETTEIHKGITTVESETNTINFFSKVQMWSLHSKKYQGNSAMSSQTSSVIASCNTDSLQKKIFDLEDSTKTAHDHNNEFYYNSLSNEDSSTSRSNEEDNIFEELNNSGIDLETSSSTKTVTPVKMEKNSEEVSTAYETDSETGKLVLNRFLRPITNSTPIKLEVVHKKQDYVHKRRPNENSLEGSTHSSNIFPENKDNQCLDDVTKNKCNWSVSVIDESTKKSESQGRTDQFLSELSSHVNLLVAYDEINKTETNNVLNKSDKKEGIELNNNKQSKLNDSIESSVEKHCELLSGADKPAFQQGNSNNSESESIIENSENNSQRTFKKENNYNIVKPCTSSPACTDKQEDKFAEERYTTKTKEISNTSNIQNFNTYTVSETPDSNKDQEKNSNEATYGSWTKSHELNSIKKVTLNQKTNEKSSADSHSTDIIYDTSNITEDCKFGQYNKTSTAGFANTIEEEYEVLGSENLINENGMNNCEESVITGNKKRLSAVSESIINDNSKIDKFKSVSSEKVHDHNKIFHPNETRTVRTHPPLTDENSSPKSVSNYMKNKGDKTDLGFEMQETFSKKIFKNRKENVSHITFLIRDPTSAEDRPRTTESGYQQLMSLSQTGSTSKIKQYDQNEEENFNEILLPGTKIHNEENTADTHVNEALKLPNLNLLALEKNSSKFSIGVENSHFERSLLSGNNDEHKYFTRSRTYLSLKRKLATIHENDSGSDTSLSQDELPQKEIKTNLSSNVYSTVAGYSESAVTTDTSSIEMNLKRVNIDLRRKRARMKKENPERKSSTSSSEDEIKKTFLLEGKSLESSKSPDHKVVGSSNKMKQSDKFDLQDNINIVDTRTQQNTGRSNTSPKAASKNLPSLTLSFENQTSNINFDHRALNRGVGRDYNHLSDSSSSIIYSSPNNKIRQHGKITKTYDKSKIHFDKMVKKRQMEEDSPCFSDANRTKKRSDKSHKSYQLYRKYDGSNKENSDIPLKDSKPNIEYPKKPLKQSTPEKHVTFLDTQKDRNETKYSDQNMKKNRKSSIVRLMGTAEGSQISNSPEVKGLLRRTYFMGNH